MKKMRLIVIICIISVLLLSHASSAYASYADERWQWTSAGVQQERCTYRAWHEAYDRLGISLPLNWGNAATWAQNARNQGYNVDSTPRADSIVCWGGGTEGWGHVAYVTGVSGNTVYIREGGINPTSGQYYRDTSFSMSNPDRWSGFWLNGFTHLRPATGVLDVNGLLDGSNSGNTAGYGTFDIYINGVLAGDDANDYYNESVSADSSYVITDIRATTGHLYTGGQSRITGTVAAGQTVTVELRFDTCTDHSYGAGVVTKEASCTAEGVRTFTCTKCGSKKTESIPKIAHTPVTDPAVPASVTATGLTEGSHCSVCGTVLKAQEIVPKLPRVLYDFDMDGSADPVIKLPAGTVTVEEEAFAGSAARAVIIPAGVTVIGSRAFADMPGLTAVFLPETVKTISFDVFDGSPNVTLYVQKGSRWGNRLDLPAVELESGWVEEDAVPAGAVITDEQWHYDYIVADTKKTIAPITEDGWTLVSTDWKVVSTGSQKYVDSYPSGYSGSKSYTTDKWTAYQTATAKREVSTSFYTYIYWHWCFNPGYLSSGNYNVYVSDIPYETDDKGYYHQYFTAFESASDTGHTDPNGANGGDWFYFWRNVPEDGSWWWRRFPVYQQTRVDKQAEYTYSQNVNESRVSDSPVEEGGAIQNVKHLVQYSFA